MKKNIINKSKFNNIQNINEEKKKLIIDQSHKKVEFCDSTESLNSQNNNIENRPGGQLYTDLKLSKLKKNEINNKNQNNIETKIINELYTKINDIKTTKTIENDLYTKINEIKNQKIKLKNDYYLLNENNNYEFISSIENKDLIDDYNKIELLTCIGDDLTIIKSCNLYTSITQNDNTHFKKILRYLINNNIDIFRQTYIQFKFNMPIYIKNKWIELSSNLKRCYFIIDENNYIPQLYLPKLLKKSLKYNLNGSLNESISNNEKCLNLIKKHYNESIQLYNILIKNNVSLDIALSILPQSSYISFIETGSLYDYFIMYKNYNNDLKYSEITDYISAINNILKKKFPESWIALINN